MAVTEKLSVGQGLLRVAVLPVWVALAVVAVPFAFGVSVSPTLRYLPFLASLLVFGLPHGATDHLAVARLGGSRPLATVGAVYLVGGAVYLAVWAVAPVLAFVAFILLTWYHWGQGDLYLLLAVDGEHLRTRGQRALALAVRGGIPMVVPLVAFPDVYQSVAEVTVSLFDPAISLFGLGLTTSLAPVFRPEVRFALGGGLALLSVASLAVGFVRSGGLTQPESRARRFATRGWQIDALETVLLWAYFLLVPPILAIGLYFCLWHSVRHIARLLVMDDSRARGTSGPVARALAKFGRDALPNTVGALVLLGALALALPADATLQSSLGLYLVALAVLTLPHTAIVTWMDLREGVWSR